MRSRAGGDEDRGHGDREAQAAARARLEHQIFLHALLDSMKSGVVACDAAGYVVVFNRAVRRRRPHVPHLHVRDLVDAFHLHAADGTPLKPEQAPLVRALAGEHIEAEHLLACLPGAPAHRFAVTACPIDAPDGRRMGAMSILDDITDAHRVQTLRAAQNAVARVLAATPSAEQAAVDVVAAVAAALGWRCGEYWQVGADPSVITRVGVWAEPGERLADFLAGRAGPLRPGQGIVGTVWADGEALWITDLAGDPRPVLGKREAVEAGLHSAIGMPVRSGDRTVGVLAFFTDIIEGPDEDLLDLLGGVCAHVGRYMERRRSDDLALALTATRRRFDRIISQVNDLVWTLEVDDDGARSIYISGNAPGVLGSRGPHEFDEGYVHRHVHPDDRSAFAGMLAEFRAERPAEAEYRIIGLDGVTRWIWSRAVPRREDGRILVDGVSTDITDRHRVAEGRELMLTREREQVRRLRDLDRMKDELVAVVSHEIRSPIAVIRGYAEMLADDPDLDDEQRRYADVIDRKSTHLQHLVDDLLDLARLDTGGVGIDARPLSLNRLVRQAVDDHRVDADAKRLTVTVNLDRHLPVVADPVRIRQMLDNLLSNAVKYTPEGGSVAVTASCGGSGAGDGEECRSRTVTLTIADTGIGIPDEQYPRLFDRFFRASTATDAGIKGTGLGLAITKAIIAAHGGSITAAPRGNGGTVFTVELPAAPGRRGTGPP